MHIPLRHVIRIPRPNAGSSMHPTGNSTSAAVTPPPAPPTIHLSTSARSLIGSFAVFGALLLAFVAWKMRSYWKRKNGHSVPERFSIVFKTTAKPAVVSLTDTRNVDEPRKTASQPSMPGSPVDWATQVRCVKLPRGVTVPPIAITSSSRSPKHQDEYPPTPHSGPLIPPFPSPPPAYRILGLQTVPIPPLPPATAAPAIPPPTPMFSHFTEPVSTPLRESFDLPPVPSPRSASFNTSASVVPTTLPTVFDAKPLPRLMIVSTSFQPTRDDELGVRAGETLRLLKEFEDEWCLVQRVGRSDAKKGVVPRFCLTDRPRVVKDRGSFLGLAFNGVRRK